MERPNVLELTREQLRAAVAAAGQPAYRADQLADWVFDKGVADPAAMSNLPSALAERLSVLTSRIAGGAEDTDETLKLLLEFADGGRVETVMIPSSRRATACVSTQIGCAMQCSFCASGAGGLERNLTCGEILEQVVHLRGAGGRRITNVVFMGMGEPLANYDATVAAVRALIDPDRFGISARSVTVSTIGLARQIRRLADEHLPITLAISLHAPTDALRRRLMPTPGDRIEDIVSAADYYYHSRKREVTLEYVLIAGVNDTSACADAVADLAHRIRCNVNLIPLNPTADCAYNRPTSAAVGRFADHLSRRGVNAHVRRSRGQGLDAACGQLRRRAAESE